MESNSTTTSSIPPITKIYQTDFDPGKGNALQAAIASLFSHPLDSVPNFITSPNGYYEGIQSYCSPFGVECIKVSFGNDCSREEILVDHVGKLGILRGKSPRGTHGHVVLARIEHGGEFQMVHDVHPDETFLDEKEDYGWFMIFEGLEQK